MGTLDGTAGDRELSFRGSSHGRLRILIDGTDDETGTELTGQAAHLIKFLVAILEVGRIDDALARGMSKSRLDGRYLR